MLLSEEAEFKTRLSETPAEAFALARSFNQYGCRSFRAAKTWKICSAARASKMLLVCCEIAVQIVYGKPMQRRCDEPAMKAFDVNPSARVAPAPEKVITCEQELSGDIKHNAICGDV